MVIRGHWKILTFAISQRTLALDVWLQLPHTELRSTLVLMA